MQTSLLALDSLETAHSTAHGRKAFPVSALLFLLSPTASSQETHALHSQERQVSPPLDASILSSGICYVIFFFLSVDRPYVCLPCNQFFQTKNELTLHTASHATESNNKQTDEQETDNDDSSSNDQQTASVENKTQLVELPNGTKIELQNVQNGQLMSLERMRMLLAILLKRISTPNRLRRLGYGSKLIDIVLVKSIESSGRKPVVDDSLDTRSLLKGNIEILLDWTIPREYMDHFRKEKKTVEEILEELTS